MSILDTRGGANAVQLIDTHIIYDLCPDLDDPSDGTLPRIDPEEVACVERCGRDVCAVALERKGDHDDRGSVAFFDLTGCVDGATPAKITRLPIGLAPGAEGEYVRSSRDGRVFYAATEGDVEGSIACYFVNCDDDD